MKQSLAFACFILTSFFFFSNSMAASATATQTVSINVPEVNLLDIPETVYIDLTLGKDGYYSGKGDFNYAITTNTRSATEKKQIMASIVEPNFGETGNLVITMLAPSKKLTHSTVFQNGETESKVLVGNIANVADSALSFTIAVNNLSPIVVQNSIINNNSSMISYPIAINYTLGY